MKNILLIGLGRFGRHIALQLNKLGHEVMAVDINEERVNESLTIVTNAQIGDSTNTEFLRSLGIGNFDVCIVTIGGNFQNSLETTSLLKELGAKLVVSRAERDVQEKFLLRNGADEVIYPEKQVANWAAIRYTADHIRDYIEVDEGHAIFEVEVPEGWIRQNRRRTGYPQKIQHQYYGNQGERKNQYGSFTGNRFYGQDHSFGSRCLQRTAKVFSHLTEVNEDG
mgnify:CR=1 FL=1